MSSPTNNNEFKQLAWQQQLPTSMHRDLHVTADIFTYSVLTGKKQYTVQGF